VAVTWDIWYDHPPGDRAPDVTQPHGVSLMTLVTLIWDQRQLGPPAWGGGTDTGT
jgi:hypothetical protein